MYQRFISMVVRHPLLVLMVVVAVTAAMATRLPSLTAEGDFRTFLPPGDAALENLDLLETTFGSPYFTRIIVERSDHPDGVYNPETLALIGEITEWLKTRPEFETDINADLRSLSTVNNITGDKGGMIVESFLEKAPLDSDAARAVRRAVHEGGLYVGLLSGYGGRAASILARESALGAKDRVATYLLVRDYLAAYAKSGRPEKFYITGRTVIEGLFSKYIPEESRRMAPFVVAMLCVLLYVCFASVRGVVIPLFVIACAEVWMLGFLGMWGHPFYTVTSILPVLLIAIAVADSIHLLAKYYQAQEELPGADRTAVVERTMRSMGAPVLMTSITTAVGFLSMTVAPLPPIRDFGVLASVGIVAALVITLAAIPAFLSLLPLDGPRTRRRRPTAAMPLDRILARPTMVAHDNPLATAAVFGSLLVAAIFGMLRLTADSSQVGQFPPWHDVRLASDKATEHFAGSMTLDVMIETGETGGLKNPDLLRRMDRFQNEFEELDIVLDTFSIAELIKRMNRAMNGDRPDAEVIPLSRELVAQYLLLYSLSADPGDFDDLVDYDYRNAHITVFIRKQGTALARAAVRHAKQLAAEIFPASMRPHVRLRLAGQAFASTHLEGYINFSQLTSLAVCLPALFLLTWFMFGRAAIGLLAIVPVSLAVSGIYGAMGYIGLPTDIATTMLGGMTLGIGVDFAIHYLHRYREIMLEKADHTIAARLTATTTGRALLYNAMVLFGGFMVLLGSRLYPQMKLGGLIAVTMVICCVATMLLFPAVLRYVRFDASTD